MQPLISYESPAYLQKETAGVNDDFALIVLLRVTQLKAKSLTCSVCSVHQRLR